MVNSKKKKRPIADFLYLFVCFLHSRSPYRSLLNKKQVNQKEKKNRNLPRFQSPPKQFGKYLTVWQFWLHCDKMTRNDEVLFNKKKLPRFCHTFGFSLFCTCSWRRSLKTMNRKMIINERQWTGSKITELAFYSIGTQICLIIDPSW